MSHPGHSLDPAQILDRGVRVCNSDEDTERKRLDDTLPSQYATLNEICSHSHAHKSDKDSLELQLFKKAQESLPLSECIETYERMAVMFATETVWGLGRIFAEAVRKETLISGYGEMTIAASSSPRQ